MVSIAPNRFLISGIILSKKKDGAAVVVEVGLSAQKRLQGPESFLPEGTGKIRLYVAAEYAKGLAKGSVLTCEIRRTPGCFWIIPASLPGYETLPGN